MTNPCSYCGKYCDELKGNMKKYCSTCQTERKKHKSIRNNRIQANLEQDSDIQRYDYLTRRRNYEHTPQTIEKNHTYQAKYRNRPDVQVKIRAYRQKPESKKNHLKYNKKYYAKLEVQEHRRAYWRSYFRKSIKKE